MYSSYRLVLLNSRLNVLMLLFPPTAFTYYMIPDSPGSVLFVTSLLALVPFAGRLGYATEQLAMHTNDTFGGLINATFGNASELIFSCFALRDRLYRVAQLSLLGSMLSNLLLVLGCACLAGGMKHPIQSFTMISGSISPALLIIATASLALPAAMKMSGQEDDPLDELNFSRSAAVVMLGMYAAYLVFQLRTHVSEFGGNDPPPLPPTRSISSGDEEGDGSIEMVITSPTSAIQANSFDDDTESLLHRASEAVPSDSDETPSLAFHVSVKWLIFVTACVAVLSDVLIGTMQNTSTMQSLNPVFTAAIIIPIFGNAAEHAAAVVFAYRNKMDICLGIAIGSSIQIALCVVPACVVFGWFTGREFTLFFQGYETAALVMSVLVVSFFLNSGTSNWLIGVLLIGMYSIIAAGFLVHERENVGEEVIKTEWKEEGFGH